MLKLLRYALLFVLLLVSTPGVAKESLMFRTGEQNPKPEAGKALLVFLRPSFIGGAFSSTVYEAPDDATRFLGVVDYGDRLAVQMAPGGHRLMVIGENADFVDVTLDAGKTYYLLVRPRPGFGKSRFSLLPLHNRADAEYNLLGDDFKGWMDKTRYVSKTPAADVWYEKHKDSVAKKKADYLVKWNKMLPQDRAPLVLNAEDGVPAQ